MFSFNTPWKHQKISGFFMITGGIILKIVLTWVKNLHNPAIQNASALCKKPKKKLDGPLVKKHSFMSKNLTKCSGKNPCLKTCLFFKITSNPIFIWENKLKELIFAFKSLFHYKIKLIWDFYKMFVYFIRFENSKNLVLRFISKNFHKSP